MIEALQQHYTFRQKHQPSEQRDAAWHSFLALGLPTQRHEQWRYISLRSLQGLCAPVQMHTDIKIPAALKQYAAKLVIVDGRYDPHDSDILHQGISLTEAEQPIAISSIAHPLAQLSNALTPKPLTITVAANQTIADPIEIIMVATAAANNASFHMSHHIVLERSAQATILIRYISLATGSYWCNINRHITLKSGAVLRLNLLQDQHESAVHTEVNHIAPGRDAQLKISALSLGAKLARFDFDAQYQHTGASCAMLGGYYVNGSQVVDYHMAATHTVGQNSTEQFVQGIADGKSRAVFNGRVKIDKNAAGSCSQQTNHNLLLSDRSEIDTKPELEIDHDDVKCRHGATVGHLDTAALFYLQSRGLSLEQAKTVLQVAFMKVIIDKIEDSTIREHMKMVLMARWSDVDIDQECI